MEKYEDLIRTYLVERDWDQLRPADLAKSISIEAAELLEIFQWSHQTLAEVETDAAKMESVKKELADVLIYCLEMSVLLKLDTGAIVERKLELAKEKYPAHLFKNRDTSKEPGTEDLYLKIKRESRMRGD